MEFATFRTCFLVFSLHFLLTNKSMVKIKDMVVSENKFWKQYILVFIFKKCFVPLLGFANTWIPFMSFSWDSVLWCSCLKFTQRHVTIAYIWIVIHLGGTYASEGDTYAHERSTDIWRVTSAHVHLPIVFWQVAFAPGHPGHPNSLTSEGSSTWFLLSLKFTFL